MYLLPAEIAGSRESVSTKCPNDKKITEHEFAIMQPVTDDPDTNPMDLLKLTKRLAICTECGLLRLIN